MENIHSSPLKIVDLPGEHVAHVSMNNHALIASKGVSHFLYKGKSVERVGNSRDLFRCIGIINVN